MILKREKLIDICETFTDGDWIESKDQAQKGIRLLQTGNVKLGNFSQRLDKARYINNETFHKLNCKEVFEGDILISRLPEPVGRSCLIPKLSGRAITAVDCTIVRPNKCLLPKYLNYYMQSYEYFNDVQKKITGATRQRISRKNLGQITIPIPEISEQKLIIKKIDAAFAEIENNIINLQNKKVQISTLKENIIKDRFKESSENLQKYFSEVCTLKRGYDLPKMKRKKGKFPLLSANGITDYIDTFKISGPGVITGRSGTIGKVHFIEKDFHPLNTSLYVRDFKGNFEKYIYYLLSSFNLKRFSSGAGVPTLNRNVLSDEVVFVNPDKDSQIKISENLDSLVLEIDKLFSIILKKEELYKLLKSSILSNEFKFTNK